MDLTSKVLSTVRKHAMLSGGEKVLIALSGGPDSVCLTAILSRLAPELDLALHALYVDHGLRPNETPQEAEFCASLCESLNIPFEVERVDVKGFALENRLNKQEAARQLRYHALDSVAARIKAKRIALGHTLDDQVETFFMRVMRGAGIRGLSGIPPVRGMYIRPLIEVERPEIEEFLARENLSFVTDTSNLQEDYLRNKLRTRLIPVLKEIDPSLMKTLAHTTDVFREEEKYLEIRVTKAMLSLISRKSDKAIELFLAPLETMDTFILRRVLRRAMEATEGLRGIGFVHVEDVIRLIKGGSPGDSLNLPKGVRAVRRYSTLLITSEPPKKLRTYEIGSEGEVHLEEAGLVLVPSVSDRPEGEYDGRHRAVFDADKVVFPLTARARMDGDFFYPVGFGRRKKLQDFLVDMKIPREERDLVPIVLSGDDVVWVAGLRQDGRFAVTEDTRRFLTLELKKAL